MATAPLPPYVTVDEFDRMELDPDCDYELLNGEIIEMSHPTYSHFKTAKRAAMLLDRVVLPGFEVDREVPYVLEPGTKRAADVAVLSASRDRTASREDRLIGAPELVIEVVSPSNRSSHDIKTASLCLRNGALQFWMVYPEDRIVDIWTPDRRATRYEAGALIRLPEALGGGQIAVDDIFSDEPENTEADTPLS